MRSKASFVIDEMDPILSASSFQYVGAYSPNVSIASVNDEDLGGSWALAWGNSSAVPSSWLYGYIPENQHPRLDSFDPEADLMFSRMIESQTRPDQIDLAFARVGSIAKITLKDLPVGERVTRGYWTVGSSWQALGGLVYDYTKGKIAILPPESDGQDADEKINFLYNEDDDSVLNVDENGKAVIWLRVLSGTLSDHFSVTVYTEDSSGEEHEYVKEVDLVSTGRSIIFDEGGITEFTVGMEAVDPGTPETPNIHDYVTFSENTYTYFPELASEHPVIRIPKIWHDSYDYDYYTFGFRSNYSAGDVDFLTRFVDDDDPDYRWLDYVWHEDYKDCLEVQTSERIRTGKMVFYSPDYPDRYPSIEIPVEEYEVPILRLGNGQPILSNQCVVLYPGQETTLTAEFPAWMTVTSPTWSLSEGAPVSLSQESFSSEDNIVSVTISAAQDSYIVYNKIISFEIDIHHLPLAAPVSNTISWDIFISPVHIYDQNGNNITYSTLYLKPGDELYLNVQTGAGIHDGVSYTKYWDICDENDLIDLILDPDRPETAKLRVKGSINEKIYVYYILENDDYYYDAEFYIISSDD